MLAGGHRDFRWLRYTEVLLCGDLLCMTEVSEVKDVKVFLYHRWIARAELSPTFFRPTMCSHRILNIFLKSEPDL